jgi:hypothetical protein
MNRRSISRVLAILLLVGLAANWRLALSVFRIRDPLGLLVGVMWLGLTVATVVGLSRVRRWGAYTLLVLAPFSTVMLATPLLPGMHLVGLRGPLALAIWNLVALVCGVVVLRTADAPETPGPGSLTSA